MGHEESLWLTSSVDSGGHALQSLDFKLVDAMIYTLLLLLFLLLLLLLLLCFHLVHTGTDFAFSQESRFDFTFQLC